VAEVATVGSVMFGWNPPVGGSTRAVGGGRTSNGMRYPENRGFRGEGG
jgi:hypothetical protein